MNVLFRLSLALVLLYLTPSHANPKLHLVFGSVAMDSPTVMYRRLSPLIEYLSDTLGRRVVLHLSPNMAEAIEQVSSDRVDLAYLTPVAYVSAHDRGGARLVAKTVTKGESSFRLMIVVKQDSPIQSPSELKGKSFAFGDEKALLQQATVLGAGLRLEDFSEHYFIGHYDNIARAVLSGDFDAGILKDTAAYKWEGKGLRILHSSPMLPPYNIAASSSVDDETLKQLTAAFLALDTQNPAHLQIIKSLDGKYDGFAATNDEEYDVVRELIAPFRQ